MNRNKDGITSIYWRMKTCPRILTLSVDSLATGPVDGLMEHTAGRDNYTSWTK